MITTDTFQSFDTGQQLKKKGFNYNELSVDRTTKTDTGKSVCLPYQTLRSAIYEKRIEIYENSFLTEELLGLEKDQNTGKVDHSPSGINSKDQADAVCGSLYSASKFADEFAYQYGEDLALTTQINDKENEKPDMFKKQATVNMDDEIKKMLAEQLGKSLDEMPSGPVYDNDIVF